MTLTTHGGLSRGGRSLYPPAQHQGVPSCNAFQNIQYPQYFQHTIIYLSLTQKFFDTQNKTFFQYFQFRGLEDVDKDTRTVVTMTLLGVGLVGTAVFLLLRPTSSWSGSDTTAAGGPYAALKRAFAIFITKDMLLLSVTNFYTGLMLTFWSGVYGPSIANTAVSIWHAYN